MKNLRVRRGSCSLSTLAPRCLPGAKGFEFRLPFRIIRRETAGSPRFLGNPCTLALLFDPGRPSASRRERGPRCCHPVRLTPLALQPGVFGAQSHGSRARCLRLAVGLPFSAQDSLAACWLCFGRVGFTPTGFHLRISRWHRVPPFLTNQAFPGAITVHRVARSHALRTT